MMPDPDSPQVLERTRTVQETTDLALAGPLVGELVDNMNTWHRLSQHNLAHSALTQLIQDYTNHEWNQILDVMRKLERYDPTLFTTADLSLMVNIRGGLHRAQQQGYEFTLAEDRPRPIARQFLSSVQSVINRYRSRLDSAS